MNEEVKKSRKATVLERLRSRMPDRDLNDEETLYGALDDEYNESEQRYNDLYEKDQKLAGLFTSNPRFAGLFIDVYNGKDLLSAFIEQFGREALEACEDPGRMKEILEADRTYRERENKSREIADEQKKNLENSAPVLEAFQQEKGISDEEMNQLVNAVCDDASAIFMGIFSREVLEGKWKAEHYDSGIAEAEHVGEIRGRNEKIDTLRLKSRLPQGVPPTLTSKSVDPVGMEENPTLRALRRLNRK